VPWLTFGGAETVIYNFCKVIKEDFNITYVTGLESEHEWEYKFKEITSDIYHLPNLFKDKRLYLEFVSNYVSTRKVKILHIIHTGYMFDVLEELKKRHPDLKIIVTLFNARVEYFKQSIEKRKYIDSFTTDNNEVSNSYKKQIPAIRTTIIPNGIDNNNQYNPSLFDRSKEREPLGLSDSDLAVFFIGRLSEEKNPDVFIKVAKKVLSTKSINDVKFFVIGDGKMKSNVEKLIKAVNNDKLQYLGYQSEVAKYLSAADVFILPSSIEGFPLSILEAMAMKVAVVASKVGAIPEMIESGQSGFVVTPGSVEEISEAIQKLRDDPSLLSVIKNNGRVSVEKKYSSTIMGESYKKLYKGLLE
jgi:glycosyltransferase involved in cell wall biosynthesis